MIDEIAGHERLDFTELDTNQIAKDDHVPLKSGYNLVYSYSPRYAIYSEMQFFAYLRYTLQMGKAYGRKIAFRGRLPHCIWG